MRGGGGGSEGVGAATGGGGTAAESAGAADGDGDVGGGGGEVAVAEGGGGGSLAWNGCELEVEGDAGGGIRGSEDGGGLGQVNRPSSQHCSKELVAWWYFSFHMTKGRSVHVNEAFFSSSVSFFICVLILY